jgi:hypothetical protein
MCLFESVFVFVFACACIVCVCACSCVYLCALEYKQYRITYTQAGLGRTDAAVASTRIQNFAHQGAAIQPVAALGNALSVVDRVEVADMSGIKVTQYFTFDQPGSANSRRRRMPTR